MDLKACIRSIPDFPKPGIVYFDITTLLGNPEAFEETVKWLVSQAEGRDITAVAAIEARGFIFGGAVARELGVSFVPIRKPGKLPWKTMQEEYELEYGTDTIEMHVDAVDSGDRVMLIDDLLATGGTMKAAAKLVGNTGASVEIISCVIELDFLDGREKLGEYDLTTLIHL